MSQIVVPPLVQEEITRSLPSDMAQLFTVDERLALAADLDRLARAITRSES